MTKINEIYLCKICGNKVKVMNAGNGTLVCCEQPMVLSKA
jgi:superoxide reductase